MCVCSLPRLPPATLQVRCKLNRKYPLEFYDSVAVVVTVVVVDVVVVVAVVMVVAAAVIAAGVVVIVM